MAKQSAAGASLALVAIIGAIAWAAGRKSGGLKLPAGSHFWFVTPQGQRADNRSWAVVNAWQIDGDWLIEFIEDGAGQFSEVELQSVIYADAAASGLAIAVGPSAP